MECYDTQWYICSHFVLLYRWTPLLHHAWALPQAGLLQRLRTDHQAPRRGGLMEAGYQANSHGLFKGRRPRSTLHLWSAMKGPWWRHQMEAFSALLALCAGNSPVTGEFPSQRPVTRCLVLSLIYAWTNGWVNNRDAGGLRRHRAHYDLTVMQIKNEFLQNQQRSRSQIQLGFFLYIPF